MTLSKFFKTIHREYVYKEVVRLHGTVVFITVKVFNTNSQGGM
jgi:hypothetical protein